MSFNLIPKQDRIVIQIDKVEDKSEGGIILPDSAKTRPYTANVVAVGPGIYQNGALIPTNIRVGSKIMFSKYAGSKVTVDNEEYLIIREQDIVAEFGEK